MEKEYWRQRQVGEGGWVVENRGKLCRVLTAWTGPFGAMSARPVFVKTMQATKGKRGSALGGFAIGLGVAGIYFALQLWILPAAGIPT